MIYAQILENTIQNVIVIDDESIVSLFVVDFLTQTPYDAVVRIDNVDPTPGIGWTYDGTNFNPPTGD